MKPGSRHSPEVRGKIAARVREAMADPAVRRNISELTKAAMADPAIRRKISKRTKECMADTGVRRKISGGMSYAYRLDREFVALVAAWTGAPAEVRRRFLEQIIAVVIAEPLA